MVMHMGSMGGIGQQKPKHFVHVLFNNFVHDSVGGQPTAADSIDFTTIAKGNGYISTASVKTGRELKKELQRAKRRQGPVFVEVLCQKGSRKNLGRPLTTPQENKASFMQYIKQIKKKFLLVTGSHLANHKIKNGLHKTKKVFNYPFKITTSDFATINQLSTYARKGYDGIIAVGGGAILDSAKSAAILATNNGQVEDYTKKGETLKNKGILYIAVPTTAGTGSEVTPWAVVWSKNKKFSLSSTKLMFPTIALVDPELTDSMQPKITATSGIDALCQAIEAYWNIHSNPTTDKYALQAIALLTTNLKNVVRKPTKKTRDLIAKGSLLGGLAFSNTQTTICHSISYPMTIHWKIAHGQATSITLPLFIEYTFPILSIKRKKRILDAIGVKNTKQASEKIRSLISSVGLKTRLSELGIPRKGIKTIVKEGYDPERALNAPRIPSHNELEEMLAKIY